MIGGNVVAVLQNKTSSKNAFGEMITEWHDLVSVRGFLDYTSGDASYKSKFKGDVAETTHVFVCDYNKVASEATPTLSRMVIGGRVYDVLMIDDPMGLHQHLEIMLKYNEVIR